MIAPLSLSNIVTVAAAIFCLWTIGSQSSGGVVKLWRLAIPPCLAGLVALVLLAGVFNATISHDAEWALSAILGGLIGRTRGWLMSVESDQKWGLIRVPRAVDGLAAGFALVVLAMTDFTGAALEDPVIEPQHVAAAAAFCAGYLGLRALAMTMRAVRAPHVELYDTESAR
ncbi:hypothetical protein [Reyranella sp.]|jgi:hypothetical protein|uniref:hypothetical protein n=1 Tax=Reyranella sp. TaxID=1929291 RepID=UPI002F91E72A